MAYTKEQLRNIFQNKFDRDAWTAIVIDIFGANKVRRENERFTDPDEPETGYYMGYIDTPDNFRIGLFYYKINSGSVAHKKVGLRNLVKEWIHKDKGEFDAAIAVFDDGQYWRLSFVCDIKEEATAPKRFTFVFGEKDNFYRTAIDRFTQLQVQKPTFENIRKAFSVEALSDDFFDQYRELYADFVQYITGKRYVKESNKWVERKICNPNYQYETTFGGHDKLVRDYIKKMFGRIVFLYFLQRKGWLDGNRQYMHDLFYTSDNKDNFLVGVLEPLFFEVLNTDKPHRTAEAQALPGSENIPYLNGGLFAKDSIDELTCVFPENLFKRLFDFLDSYNFTIDENDTDDAEIGIDPEMLGRIFENLLEDNKDKGAFYTPKEIVDYMCRESIIAYLLNGLPERSHDLIRHFVETFDASELNDEQRLYIRKKLQSVKICDPAIGSGAFPMGLVNLLSKLYVAMKSDTDTSKMKRYIMEQSIYGVDIEPGAVDIARLRFWLAMIVEEKEPIPLPNLHFKIMQGNSLLETYNGVDLSDLTKLSTNLKYGESRGFWDTDDSERESLISSLKSYYKTSAHSQRDRLFNDIINNVRRQLYDKGITLPKGVDPSANTDFFLWHTWFSDVFENGGFDIVIGNPPYVIVSSNDPLKQIYDKTYEVAGGGKRNLFHLFFEKGISLLKKGGVISFITPDTFLAGNDTSNLRKYFLNNVRINNLILYSEKDKVFKNVTQAVAVSVMLKSVPFTNFIVQIQGENKLVKISDIKEDPKLRFRWFNQAIQKIKETKTIIKDFFEGNKGDVNLGIKKEFFRNEYNINSLPLIRGIQISPYLFRGTDQWCLKSALIKDYTSVERIVFQEVANAGLARRVKATILKNVILGDSCNFVIPKSKEISLYAALAVINSKVVNFYFKFYNQTNHVPIGDFKHIPFPKINYDIQDKLSNIVKDIMALIENNIDANISEYESEIDLIVYQLYNLSYEEVLIIDPQTSITREEYNNSFE